MSGARREDGGIVDTTFDEVWRMLYGVRDVAQLEAVHSGLCAYLATDAASLLPSKRKRQAHVSEVNMALLVDVLDEWVRYVYTSRKQLSWVVSARCQRDMPACLPATCLLAVRASAQGLGCVCPGVLFS